MKPVDMNDHRGLLGAATTGAGTIAVWLHAWLPMINDVLQALTSIVAIAVGIATIRHYRLKDRRTKADAGKGNSESETSNIQSARKKDRRVLLIFLVLAGALLLAAIADAQTNGVNANNGTNGERLLASAPANAWAAQVAEDARKLVYDFLSGFSWAGLFAAYLGVKGLRNFTPLGRGAGKMRTLLRLFNLEALDGVSTQPSSGLAEPRLGRPPFPAPAGEGVKSSEQQIKEKEKQQ